MDVREARDTDLPSILHLYQQLNPNDPQIEDGRDKAVFQSILASDSNHLLIGEAAGIAIATCYLSVIPNLSRHASPFGIIENVVIDQSQRNRGYGKQIMQHTLTRAWQAGCYKVMLQTGSKRESTHHFYEACGFKGDDKFAFVARP